MQPRRRPGVSKRLALLVVGAAAAGGIGGGAAIHAQLVGSARPAAPVLPAFHGQVAWPAGRRPAPAFALRDQDGARVSLARLRGRPLLITFLDSQCDGECPIAGRQLGSILRRLAPAQRPTLVVVSVDPAGDTPASIRHAMAKWRLAGSWRWHWLNGGRRQLAAVWHAYGIRVVPTTNDIAHGMALYLVDARGYERTGYLFPFLPGFVGSDLARLARDA